MSRLNDLIEKLCPNGVEYKTLVELGTIFKGMSGVTNKWAETGNCQFVDYKNVYNHIKIDVLDLPFATVKKTENQFVLNQGDILFTSASETPDECAISSVIEKEIVDGIFLDDHLFGIRLNKTIGNPTYFNYYFRSNSFRKSVNKTVRGVTRFYISMPDFANIKVPVPPLPVQSEIVRILDNFTELTAELSTHLTAELTARRKQYEYYRDSLLTFGDDVQKIKLTDLFDTRNGYTPSKSNDEYWNSNDLPWFRMEDIRENGRILNDAIQHVSFAAAKGKPFPKNSIIVSTSATIGEHALLTCESLANQRFTYLLLKEKHKNDFDMMFLFYYCFKLDEYCHNCLNQSNFASVDMSKFSKFEFPIIPIKKQKQIIELLSRFDILYNDISEDLATEIEARQKQYEYYRDKLLSFRDINEASESN